MANAPPVERRGRSAKPGSDPSATRRRVRSRPAGRRRPTALRSYLGIILILLIAGVVVSVPFAYQGIFGLDSGGGTGTPVSTFEFIDQTGRKRSTEEFRGSVVAIHFLYPKESDPSGNPDSRVDFTADTIRQLDVFASLAEKYSPTDPMLNRSCTGDRCVNLLTVIIPRVCCLSRPMEKFFEGTGYKNYELEKITWPVARDGDLFAFKACGPYIKNDKIDLANLGKIYDQPLAGDPSTVILDKEHRLATAQNIFLDEAWLGGFIDAKLDNVPIDPQFEYKASKVNVAALFGLLALLGAISLLSPCCLGIAVASVSSILQIQKSAGPSMQRRDSLLVGLSFSLGMGAVFFVIGIAVALFGLFIKGDFFLIGTAVILIALGLMAFGVHRPLVNRYETWKYERVERKHAADHPEKHAPVPIALLSAGSEIPAAGPPTPKMGEPGCPHCARVAASGGEDERMKSARTGRNAGFAALASGAMFGAVGIPCAAIFILAAIAIVATESTPLLVGGAFLFAFGFARGVLTVPLAVGANAVSKSKGGLAQFIVKHRKHINWVFGISLFAFAAYLLAKLLLFS